VKIINTVALYIIQIKQEIIIELQKVQTKNFPKLQMDFIQRATKETKIQ
jgi:hypothetical protein